MFELDKVSISVGEKLIVDSVSFRIGAGDLHLLLGKNGSGKTSLCLSLAGHPDYKIISGNFSLDGFDLTEKSPEERARRGVFVGFQNPPAIEGLSVVQLLKTAVNSLRNARGEGDISAPVFFQKLQEYQSYLNIEQSLLTRSLNKDFSGGEKKKVELLQLLFLSPKIAILDEPDSGVDINTKRLMTDTINRLRNAEKTAFLVVTHTFDFAKTLNPTQVHILQNGQLIQTGNAELLTKIEQNGFE